MKTQLSLPDFAPLSAGLLYYTLLLMLFSISTILTQPVTIRYVKAGETDSPGNNADNSYYVFGYAHHQFDGAAEDIMGMGSWAIT